MVVNIRDPKTGAAVHPQYNLLNVAYRLYVQIFERIEKWEFPEYVSRYMQERNVTLDRVRSQQALIADLLDGLFAGEYQRETGTSYLRKAMADCRWTVRFDWEAMAVFDLLASQSLLAYYFGAVAELACEEDLRLQNAGELRLIVDRMCRRAVDRNSTSRGISGTADEETIGND